MSITEELREWVEQHKGWHLFDIRLNAIADRIDAEHKRLMQEQPFTVDMVPMTDERMAEHGWIRLPVDADGEYIHIGDVMAYTDNTKPMEVVALVPPAVFLTEDGPRYADMCRHYHAPAVEDVLREFVTEFNRDDSELCDEEIIERFSKRLQLREDA